MVEKYNKLYLLVHPLYDIFFPSSISELIDEDYNKTSISTRLKNKSRPTIQKIKKTLGIYGEMVEKISKDKDGMLVIFEPQLKDYTYYSDHFNFTRAEYKELREQYSIISKLQKKVLSKFIANTTQKLQDRVIISNYDTHNPDNQFIPKTPEFYNDKFIQKFNHEVKIIAFGEFYTPDAENKGCVPGWAKAIDKLLRFKGIKSEITYLNERTLPFKSAGIDGFRKAVLPAHQKREIRKEEKKSKHKFNKIITNKIKAQVGRIPHL